MTLDDINDLIRTVKSQLLPILENMFDLDLDYSPFSLSAVEQQINESYPEGHKVMEDTTYIPYGVYLGEVIVKNFPNAKWCVDKDTTYLSDVYISIPYGKKGEGMDFRAFPFMRIYKFWKDRTDSLVAYYNMIKASTDGTLRKYATGDNAGKWVTLPNGTRVRVHEVKKGDDEYENLVTRYIKEDDIE